jgi:hypothetical protein
MRWNTWLRAFAAIVSAATVVLALVIGGHAVAGATASSTNSDWVRFNDAHWVNGAGEDASKFGLVTTSTCPTGYPTCLSDGSFTYGGISLKAKYVPSDLTSITALSFNFSANQDSTSPGGSPRMVVQFSDGGNAQLRPLAWTANTWTHVDGMTGNNWDNDGGCGYRYATTWAGVVACHAGATITAIYMVNDSGWAVPSYSEQVTLDNITVNNITATGPGSNN